MDYYTQGATHNQMHGFMCDFAKDNRWISTKDYVSTLLPRLVPKPSQHPHPHPDQVFSWPYVQSFGLPSRSSCCRARNWKFACPSWSECRPKGLNLCIAIHNTGRLCISESTKSIKHEGNKCAHTLSTLLSSHDTYENSKPARTQLSNYLKWI